MATTKSVAAKNSSVADLTEEAIAELYQGAPESFSDPGEETVPVEHEQVQPPSSTVPDGKVMLTNIVHTEEVVLLPDSSTKRWSGKKAQFSGGRLVADAETADAVLAACPHVYAENMDGHWFTHSESKFRTTNPEGFERYSKIWAENR